MNTDLLLDVTELALTNLHSDSSVCFIHIDDIYRELLVGKTLCKTKATKAEVKRVLRTMFPIYKNRKKHTVLFKISSESAYGTCRTMHIRLRPLSDIVRAQGNLNEN